jgi:hypothetical protein
VRRAIAFLPLGLVLVAVLSVFLAATRTGIGISPDSTVYLDGARSIADGAGYVHSTQIFEENAIKHFPPLYSTLLAGTEVVGIGVISGARLVNGVLLTATTALLYLLVLRSTRGSHVAAALAGVAFGLSFSIVQVTSRALSESPFLFIVVAWGLAAHYLARDASPHNRAFLVVLTALAPLVRYAGYAFIVALPVVLLLLDRPRGRRGVRRAFVLTLLAATPAVLWALRNALAEGPEQRKLGSHLPSLSKVREGIDVVAGWVFPTPIPSDARPWLLLALVIGVGIVAGVHARRIAPWIRDVAAQAPGAVALTVFGVAYLMVLTITISFIDGGSYFSFRELAPVFVVFLVDAAVAATRSPRTVQAVAFAAASVVVGFYAVQTGDEVRAAPIRERGLTASFFARSKLLDVARQMNNGTTIYSDGADLIFANTGLTNVRNVPRRYSRLVEAENPGFDAEVRRMGADVLAGRDVIIMWKYVDRPNLMTTDDLSQRVSGLGTEQFPDGVVFKKP